MAKKETTLSVADMKKAIWEKYPRVLCRPCDAGYEILSPSETYGIDYVDLGLGGTSDDAWRNAYDAIIGGKK